MPFYTGSELKLKRRERGVTQKAVAAEMGVDPARISNIEARAVVPVLTASRYLQALEKAVAA